MVTCLRLSYVACRAGRNRAGAENTGRGLSEVEGARPDPEWVENEAFSVITL